MVISGGGSKGAFAIRVLMELFSTYPQLNFDTYLGTSAGALVVSLTSLKKMDTLKRIYITSSYKDLFVEGNIVLKLGETSLFDV